jgi:hypothetical protein
MPHARPGVEYDPGARDHLAAQPVSHDKSEIMAGGRPGILKRAEFLCHDRRKRTLNWQRDKSSCRWVPRFQSLLLRLSANAAYRHTDQSAPYVSSNLLRPTGPVMRSALSSAANETACSSLMKQLALQLLRRLTWPAAGLARADPGAAAWLMGRLCIDKGAGASTRHPADFAQYPRPAESVA